MIQKIGKMFWIIKIGVRPKGDTRHIKWFFSP